jgi:DNA-directed RNA polymerase specialized sigma24 family protein
MSDFDPSTVDWGRVFAEALEIAQGVAARDAEDLVQQGMTLLLEGTAPFDPAGGVALPAHIVKVALEASRNRERSERRRRRPQTIAKLAHWLDGEPPTPEELNHARRLGERAFEAVLAACGGDDEVRDLVLLARDEDLDEPAEQRDRLNWPIEKVRNARRRMARVYGNVAASMPSWKEEGS